MNKTIAQNTIAQLMKNYTGPEWVKSALITIDIQCDTLDDQPYGVQGTSAILPHVKTLLQAYRLAKMPIIHIVRLYKADGSNVDLCRKEIIENGAMLVVAGSPGSQIVPELVPHDQAELDVDLLLSGNIQKLSSNETIIYKPRWGAFYQTQLEEYLRNLGVSTLLFCGCNFPNCPRTSMYEASERDFRVVLAEDAISGLYTQGKSEMRNIGVELYSVEQAVKLVEDSIKQA